MSAALDDWCKAWLKQARIPVAPAPADLRVKLGEPPAEDQITHAVLLRFELLERCKACGAANKRQQLRERIETVSHWLAAARRLAPAHPRRHDFEPPEPRISNTRVALNAILQQHVLSPTPWIEHHSGSDRLARYLSEAGESLFHELGVRSTPQNSQLSAFRAVRAVSAEYGRAGITPIHFGHDLARAIEHFGGMVEIVLGEALNHFPVRWLPFLVEAALDERGARRYAHAIACHLDIILTAGDHQTTFALLRERHVHDLEDLMTHVQPQRASMF
jgi:hypothetical protein